MEKPPAAEEVCPETQPEGEEQGAQRKLTFPFQRWMKGFFWGFPCLHFRFQKRHLEEDTNTDCQLQGA